MLHSKYISFLLLNWNYYHVQFLSNKSTKLDLNLLHFLSFGKLLEVDKMQSK